MKKIINITLWIAGLAGLSLLVGFIESEHKKITCKELRVEIHYGEADPMIQKNELNQLVYNSFDSLVGKKLTDINTAEIERFVHAIPTIESAEVFTSINGTMKIRVRQRQPILRILASNGPSYYMDAKGKIFPVQTGRSNRVLVASGHIPVPYADTLDASVETEASVLHQLYRLSRYIRNDAFLRAQIEQVYVTEEKEFEMVPKVGRHLIEFGGIEEMENKFSKLKVFYNDGMKKAGWDVYGRINLKYRDQVVCVKK
jgi:cell division protein FtsQ